MAPPQNPGDILETMEKGTHEIQDAEGAPFARVEGTRNGQLQKRSMESGGDAQRGALQENISGQTGISIPVGPLSESSRKLLNRVVPNGTLRGVEGEAKTSPIRFIRDDNNLITLE